MMPSLSLNEIARTQPDLVADLRALDRNHDSIVQWDEIPRTPIFGMLDLHHSVVRTWSRDHLSRIETILHRQGLVDRVRVQFDRNYGVFNSELTPNVLLTGGFLSTGPVSAGALRLTAVFSDFRLTGEVVSAGPGSTSAWIGISGSFGGLNREVKWP